MARRSRARRFVRLLLWAVLSVVLVAQAGAADPNEDAGFIRQGLRDVAGKVSELAGQSVLGEPLPLVGVTPSQVIQLDQLLTKAVDALPPAFDEKDPTTAAGRDELRQALEGLDTADLAGLGVSLVVGCDGTCPDDDATPVTVTETSAGSKVIDLTIPVKASRSISDKFSADIGFAQFDGGTLGAEVVLDTVLSLRVDLNLRTVSPATAVKLPTAGGGPRIDLTATVSGSPSLKAALGFTDVTVDLRGENASDPFSASFVASARLADPDADGVITMDELQSTAISDLAQLTRSGTIAGNLRLATTSPALGPVDLPFSHTFGDAGGEGFGVMALGTGEPFSLPSFSLADLGAFAPFTNITPEQVISGFGQAAAALAGAQQAGDLPLPFLDGALSDVFSVAEPVFSFANQQAVVCGLNENTPPTGIVPDLVPAGTKVYCQAFVVHDPALGDIAEVEWHIPTELAGKITYDGPADQADRNKTIALAPGDHAEFTVTEESAFDVYATYEIKRGATFVSAHRTERPARTAQQLLTKLAELGGFEELADMLTYDSATETLRFRLSKSFDSPQGSLPFDFGDQLDKGTGIIGLQAAPGVGLQVQATGIGLDITIGVALGELEDIGAGQPCANPSLSGNTGSATCPLDVLDRFFVEVNPDEPEFFVEDGSFGLAGAGPMLGGRLGFVELIAQVDTFAIAKKDGADDLLAVELNVPHGGLKIGSATLPNAVRLRELLFSIADRVETPSINLKFDASLSASATVRGQTLGTGSITVTWPDVTEGTPTVTADNTFKDTLAGFNVEPNLFGTHTGAASPATAPDPDNPSPTPAPAVLTDSAASFTEDVIGARIENLNDGSFCDITARTATTVTCANGLGGGRVNQWNTGDEYRIKVGDPLEMLWRLLDNLDAIVGGIDSLTGAGVGALYETNLPLVGVSPKQLVRQISDLRRAAQELRGGPQPEIQCGTTAGSPPTGDPSDLGLGAGETAQIHCEVQTIKPATAVRWSLEKGGANPGEAARTNLKTVVTPTTPAADRENVTFTISGDDSQGGKIASPEHPDGYRIRATFTDADGEHVVDFPPQAVPGSLQAFQQALESKLGLPEGSFTITPTGSGANRRLKLALTYGVCGYVGGTAPDICAANAVQTPAVKAPLNLDLDLAGGLVGVGAQGQVDVTYAADATVAFSVAVDTNLDPKVEPETGINVKGRFAATDVNFRANLGPLGVQAGTGGKPTGDGDGVVRLGADFSLRSSETEAQSVGDFLSSLTASFTEPGGPGQTCGTIDDDGDPSTDPVELAGVACGKLSLGLIVGNAPVDHLGDVGFSVSGIASNGTPNITAVIPQSVLDEISSRALSWDMLLQALPYLLERIEEGLRATAGAGPDGGKVPIIGDALDAGADVVGRFNSEVLPLVNQVAAVLDGIPDAGGVEGAVRDFIWDNLGPDGANLLRRSLTEAVTGPGDVHVTTYCTGGAECDDDADILDIIDVRITFNLGQGIGTDVDEPPAFDLGFDGIPLRIAGAVEAKAGWNVLVDFGLSRDLGPYLVVDDAATPGYPANQRPDEIAVSGQVGLGAAADVCSSEFDDPIGPDDAATKAIAFTPSANRCLAGKLGFVAVNVRDADAESDRTKASIEVSVDLRRSTGGSGVVRLGLPDLVGGQLRPVATLDIDTQVNLRFRTGVPALQSAGFPSVVGTFHLDWGFTKSAGGPTVDDPSRPLTVSLDNIHLDASAFFQAYLKPTLDEVRNITGPFKPVIDTLNAPLPVVSDLAEMVGEPPVTLLGLMEAISGNNLTVIKSLAAFISFAVDLASDPNFANGMIPLGLGDAGGAFNVDTALAKTAQGPAEAAKLVQTAGETAKNLLTKPVAPGTGNNSSAVTKASNTALGLTRDNLPGTFGVPGLTFPFMSDAGQIFGFLMGQDLTLVRYDIGTLRATAGFSYNFGPFFIGPVPVTAGIGGSATLEGRFALGYDTSGLRKVLSGGSGVHLFDGIFIDDLDASGVDVPEIKLIGEVYARAGVTVFVATAGIEGGITMTVGLNLDDRPEPDGKLRIEEIFNKLSNPICLFEVSGKLEAFLRAFLEINYFIGSKKWDWELVRITLLDFSAACEPPRPVLAALGADGTLTLNMGPRADQRNIQTQEENEKFIVRPAGGGRYSVEAFGVYQVYGPAAPFPGPAITKVVAQGASGDDQILMETGNDETVAVGDPLPFAVPAELDGGPGNDVLQGGDANDRLIGGDGNDRLLGRKGNDLLDGGADNDQLSGDQGHDVLLGGAGQDRLTGGAGADYLDGGADDDLLAGGPGVEPGTPNVVPGTEDLGDVLIGRGGADSLEGGWGSDILYGDETGAVAFGRNPSAGGLTVEPGLGAFLQSGTYVSGLNLLPDTAARTVEATCADGMGGSDDVLDGGAGDDTVFAGGGNDRAVGGPGNDALCGMAGNDDLDGDNPQLEATASGQRGGNDDLDGGAGNDRLRGRGGHDVLRGQAGHDGLFGGTGSDHLLGGDGNDDLSGGPGRDVLDGGANTNILVGDTATIAGADGDPLEGRRAMPAARDDRVALVSNVSTAGDDDVAWPTDCSYVRPAVTSADDAFADCLTGGSGEDVMFGEGGRDFVKGNGGADYLRGGAHADEMHGDAGVDEMYGDTGDDDMFGGADADVMRGNAGDDYMEGNGGGDDLRGDAGHDRIIGGSSTAGADDGADAIAGDAGSDVIAGDNALIGAGSGTEPVGPPGVPRRIVTLLDVAAAGAPAPSASAGAADTIDGGPDPDRIFGQAGDDDLSGGEGADLVAGNAGDDTISGGLGGDLLIGGSNASATLRAADGTAVSFTVALDGSDEISGDEGDDLVFGDDVDGDFDALEPGKPVFAGDPAAAGTFADDVLSGGSGRDVLWGQLGGDDVDGGAGQDYLVGDLATVSGDADGAPLSIWPGGAPEYDVVLVHPLAGGDDTLRGQADDDHLYGGAGADSVEGGLGDDYMEGNAGGDALYGLSATHDDGVAQPSDVEELTALLAGATDQDDIVGGSSTFTWPGAATVRSDVGETEMHGNADHDVMAGDNADIARIRSGDDWATDLVLPVARRRDVTLLDREKTGADLAAVSGGDEMFGDGGSDRMYGEGGDDRMQGNANDDYLEGNQGSDWIEGNDGEDDLIGGSSESLATLTPPGNAAYGDPDGADFLHGGAGADVIAGDNAVIARNTNRIAPADVYLTTQGRFLGVTTNRWVQLLDLPRIPGSGYFGADLISGGSELDVAFGQDGDDWVSGGPDDDYLEGNGGIDHVFGDRLPVPTPPEPNRTRQPAYPALGGAFPSADAQLHGADNPDGQDDILGGSALAGHRDGQGDSSIELADPSEALDIAAFDAAFGDYLYGDGSDDFILGDNGTLTRFSDGYEPVAGSYLLHSEARNAQRIVREAIRFDVNPAAGAFGDDFAEGGDGDDAIWGQNGDDELWGNDGDDDLHGELGSDRLYGGAGEDAMLGDRGSIKNTLVTDEMRQSGQFEAFLMDGNGPPFLTYQAFTAHRYDRRVDLYNDVEGSVGARRPGGDRALEGAGATVGGDDILRGGPDHDVIFAGGGDDLVNGDTGGDYLFGGHGSDVMWGGRGGPDDTNPDARSRDGAEGFDDAYVDYLFGGYGGDKNKQEGAFHDGSDLLDFSPRQASGSGTKKDPFVPADPELWHANVRGYDSRHGQVQEAKTYERDGATYVRLQHHHGIDWIYGGWDRDLMQANLAAPGPNDGDRLMDWAGVVNLWSHCNANYGGHNDIRAISPQMLETMQRLAYATGAGQSLSEVLTPGTSAFDNLALVYHADIKHNTGKPYEGTPGHFDERACAPDPQL